MKDYENSITDYNKALELGYEDHLLYNNRGKSNQLLERYDEAIADYDKSLAIKSDYTRAYENRGTCYYQKADYKKNIEDLKAMEKSEELKPALQYFLGQSYFYPENYPFAISYLDKAIAGGVILKDSYNNLGKSYMKLESYSKARVDYTESLKLDNKQSKVYTERAEAFVMTGDMESALADLNNAIKLDETNPDCYFN